MAPTGDSGKTENKPSPAGGNTAGNTAVPSNPAHGDHDRVAMLSLKADGTPDQHAPEIIGDKEFAKTATREQFAQQAVSAADAVRGQSVPMMTVDDGNGGTKEVPASEAPQDPSIKARQDEHEAIAKEAEQAADATVGALFVEDETDSTPAQTSGSKPKA